MKLGHLSKRDRSKRSEAALAKSVGGRVQPASGALPVAAFKGDVATKHFLFDDKNTVHSSYGVKLADMVKLRKQAFQAGHKIPVLRIAFEGYGSFFVLDEKTFLRLKGLFDESENA